MLDYSIMISLYILLLIKTVSGNNSFTPTTFTTPSDTSEENYTQFFYKKVGLDNETYRCGLESICILKKLTYNNYDSIKSCEDSCTRHNNCKGYIFYNSSHIEYDCNLLNSLGYNNLQGLEYRDDSLTYYTYIKKKKNVNGGAIIIKNHLKVVTIKF